MTDRAWVAVYATLAGVIASSDPYDALGGFLLLHSIDVALEGLELGGSPVAAHRHVAAALDPSERRREAARRSMIRICLDLESLLGLTA